MNCEVIAYCLAEDQIAFLEATLPEGYKLLTTESVTELIVADAVCMVIDAAKMSKEAMNILLAYYMDAGDRLEETVVWLGDADLPELPPFVRCDSFLDLLTELESILTRAQTRYDAMRMYSSEYAYLPKHANEESIEADIYAALRRTYGNAPDPLIVKRVRRELAALREVDVFQNTLQDLAAVFELSRWLKARNVPFFVEYTTASGLIPYLLGITQTNPLPPHTLCPQCKKLHWNRVYKDGFDIPAAVCDDCGTALVRDGHDLLWQEFCSYGPIPNYGFWLPVSAKEQIQAWLDNHWLKHTWEEIWGPFQQEEHRVDAGPLYFIFALDNNALPGDFHHRQVTAEDTEELIRLVSAKQGDSGIPLPKTAAEALAVYELAQSGCVWNQCAKDLLGCGLAVSDLICCREDIFRYLCDHGFSEKDAIRGMNYVRKGRGFPVITDEMRNARDKWVLAQCADVDWLPSRASDLERLIFQIRGGFAPSCPQSLDA